MSILDKSKQKQTVRRAAATKLPQTIQAQVERAFDSQAQFKFWENEFKASKDELVTSLDSANFFDKSPVVQTTRGTVTIQQRMNEDANLEMVSTALHDGKITAETLMRCIKKLDVDMIRAFLGHEYVIIGPPTLFPVLRPGTAVQTPPLKVAK